MTLMRPFLVLVTLTALLVGMLPLGVAGQAGSDPGAPQPTLTERIQAAILRDAVEVGGDPLAAHAWLRDRIAFEVYEGLLKGDRGTFLTGSGNGADQALLLAALLRASDAEASVRFASCPTDAGVAGVLAERAAASIAGEASLVNEAAELAEAVDDDELSVAIGEVLAEREAVRVDVEAGRAALADALATVGYPWDIELGASTDPPATHVWAQAHVGDRWLDLDVTSADGAPPCEATETHDELPSAAEHLVSFTIVGVERAGDAWLERDLLNAALPTKDLSTARVALVFGEPAGLLGEGPGGGFGLSLDTADGSRLASYTPVLRIDNEMLVGESVELAAPDASLTEGVDDALGGALDLFESMPGPEEALGDADADDPAAAPEGLAAIWLDMALIAPGGETTQLRSEVLDRIGPGAGAEADPGAIGLEPLEVVDGDYAALTTMWQVGVLMGETVVPEGALDPTLDPFTLDGLSGHLDALLRTLPAVRRDLGAPTVAPAIVLAGLGVHEEADGAVVGRLVLDALHVPTRSPDDVDAAAGDAQALLGAEQMLMVIAGTTAGFSDSAATVLGAARADGTPLMLIAPGDAPSVAGASAEATARMEQRLANGYRLLAPAVAPTIDGVATTAWWTVDPASGDLRDEHENGRHSASTEYTIQTETQLTYMERLRRFACSVARPVALAATLIYMGTGGAASPIHEVLETVAEAMQAEAERRAEREAARKAACSGTSGGA